MKTISVYALVTTVLLVIIIGCSSGGGESSFRVGYDFGALDKIAIVAVDIPHFGKETSMTAKMINVEDGSILWMGRGSSKTKGVLKTFSGFFKLQEVDAGAGIGGQEDEVLGGVDGDILGGPAAPARIRPAFGGPVGGVLSPKEAKKMQEIIETMCKSLPKRPVAKP